MADKDTLWTAVKTAYDAEILKPLTNINDRNATAIDNTYGTECANQCIGLWAMHTEVDYDVDDAGHLAVSIRGVFAILLQRGGGGSSTANKEFDKVFSDGGLMTKIKSTGPRSRQSPVTSGPDVSVDNTNQEPYSHFNSLPVGFLPSSKGVSADD
jgi:hypothetical protein